MVYFLSEDEELNYSNKSNKNAGFKARDDIEKIFFNFFGGNNEIHFRKIIKESNGKSFISKIIKNVLCIQEWNHVLRRLNSGDLIFIQYPCLNKTLFLHSVFFKAKKRGIKICFLIHDICFLRFASSPKVRAIQKREIGILENAFCLIAHNDNMKTQLLKYGLKRIFTLEIFDYLINNEIKMTLNVGNNKSIIIAGNLSKEKSGYIYNLPRGVLFKLYGLNYSGQSQNNIEYCGSFNPNSPNIIGSFGLVWDGNSSTTCGGDYGNYLKFNNPHKTSLYLAMGIPVIVWNKSAIASFVLKHNCGIVIDNLNSLLQVLTRIDNNQYIHLKSNAEFIGKYLRSGYFTQSLLKKILSNNEKL